MLGTKIVLAATQSNSSSGGINPTFIILIVLIVGAFFLMTRSNRRKQQAAQQKLNAVVPGVRVRTTAGMYATVVSVDGDDVILEVAPGIEVKYMKRAVMDVVPDDDPQAGYAQDTDDEADDVEADDAADHEPEAAADEADVDGDVSAPGSVKKD